MKRKRGISFVPYLWSVLGVAIATVIVDRWPVLYGLHSMASYTVTVVLVAWYYGLAPSLFATALSSLSFSYFVAPPAGFGISDPHDKARLLLFVLISCLFSFLLAALRDAEAKTRTMFQRLSLALEGTSMGVWDLNLASGVVWHSESLEEIFGRDAKHFAKSYEVLLGYVHSDDRDFVHRIVTRAIETGQAYRVQHRIVLPQGEVRIIETRGRVFLDPKNRPERLVATTIDLTTGPSMMVPANSAAAAVSVEQPISRPPAERADGVDAVPA